jgi:hypothetical protein
VTDSVVFNTSMQYTLDPPHVQKLSSYTWVLFQSDDHWYKPMCMCNKERNYFKGVLAKSFMEMYVLNANMVSGTYQSNQKGDSIAVNLS